jgi:hypothetical protein
MRQRLKPREQGDIGELSAMHWLAFKGAAIYLPVGHSPDVDLIASFDGRLVRVQVKTSTRRYGDRFAVQLATRGGNQSWNGVTKYLDPDRFDYLFVHVGDGRRWFIPAPALESCSGLSLGGPKYSEFEIEAGEPIAAPPGNVTTPLNLLARNRGSADVGESGQTVNLVPRAEWVRIPPPPFCRPAESSKGGEAVHTPQKFIGRFERTRISCRHQVTIPRDAFVPAGFEVGDKLHARCLGPGRVVLERIEPDHEKLSLLETPRSRED